jgi:hypothetical protein
MTWRFIRGESVSHLPSDPLGSRIGRDADRDWPAAGVTQDHQAVEQLERDRAYDEQIQRRDAGGMITGESLSTLGRVVGGAGPYTCRRLIQRLRFRASTIRRGSAVRPTASSRGSCAGSALESRNQFVDGRRRGGTSSASRRGNRVGASGSRSSAGR